MKKTILILMLLIVTPLISQFTYHPDDVEDIRAFLRQGTNYEKMGLTESDTLTWYENDAWISKMIIGRHLLSKGEAAGNPRRLFNIVPENNLGVEGKLIFRNDLYTSLGSSSNHLTEVSAPNSKNISSYQVEHNNIKLSAMPYFETPPKTFTYAPQATIEGGVFEWTDTIDLSSEYNIHGTITTFEWFDITSGTEETINQPTNENGIFTFTEEHADKKLRCKMWNALYPDLTQLYETEIVQGIKEGTISNLNISPNPTNNTTTLTLNLEKSGSLKIVLVDILGKDIMELHNSFETAGPFTKTFSVETLSKGIYYLKIENDKSIKTEKLAVN